MLLNVARRKVGCKLYNLSIVLITYNRSALLDRVLSQLAASPLSQCPLWVLNNASTDNTLGVCKKWESIFPHMSVVTHKFNIGVNANILRAYEYGDDYYKWILCDDDELHLDDIDDLLSELQSKRCDIIRVMDGEEDEKGCTRTLEEILHSQRGIAFYSFSFVPSTIFRSTVVEDEVKNGYLYTYTRYQHVFVLMRSFSPHALVYTTRSSLITRGKESGGIGSDIWLHWHRGLQALPTRRAREVALSWRPRRESRIGHLFRYGQFILSDLRNGRPRRHVFAIWRDSLSVVPSLKGKLIVIINLPFVFAPVGVLYRLMRGTPLVRRDFQAIHRARE